MANVVEAARWVRDSTRPDQRVLSGEPGIMRLYAGDQPRDRFVGFEDIEAEAWPDILAELRRRHIEYMIWHDRLFGQHGGLYSRQWRLERFELLAKPENVEGVQVVRRFADYPTLFILRVLAEPR